VAARFDHAPMLRSRIVLLVLLAVLSFGAFAADDAQAPARFDFDLARQKITEIQKKIPETTEAQDLGDFRDTVSALAAAADAIVADRTPRLAEVDARLAELGPAPAKGAPAEAADIAAQRTALTQQRTAVDAEIKRAKVLGVEAQQATAQIDEARRASFQARVSQRTASPLMPAFWRSIGDALREDGARLATIESGMASAIADAFAPDNRFYAIGGIVVAILLVIAGRWWAEGALMRLSADRVPHGRLRRSALALAIVVVVTLSMGLAAQALVAGFDWHDAFSDAEKQLAHAFVSAVFFASFVFGLGRALLSPTRPSWRLPPIADSTALAIRGAPLMLALVVLLSILVRRVNAIAGASISATVAASFVTATLYSLIVLWALVRIGRARRRADAEKPKDAEPEPSSLTAHLGLVAIGIAAIVALLAAVSGYIAFAQLLAALIVRVLIVGGTFYLLVHLIEDVFFTVSSMRAKWMQDTLGVRSRTLDQLSVVLSGAFRLVAFLFALSLIFSGFGSGRAELSALSEQIGSRALSIGEIRITPDAVLGTIAVLIVGFVAVRALKRWLHDRYLPTTSLDPAMRSSVTTLLGYVAGAIVILLALSALGFSVERIAWVASALSVGIGFGLQAVVQNFVSGLILLVERPVKVGDWVALGDVEGDIRRINVRATEIQMGDRSTMIVPNSELITKTVRNVTLANAQGRVQVRLPMPLDTDADTVLRILGEAFTSNPRVLADPAPSFTVDGIQNATLIFVGVGFIDNPRQAGGIRSEILLTLLARLREAGVRMVAPQEVAYRPLDAGPAMPDVGGNPS
jgi:small-conductance mechanosensitive channel